MDPLPWNHMGCGLRKQIPKPIPMQASRAGNSPGGSRASTSLRGQRARHVPGPHSLRPILSAHPTRAFNGAELPAEGPPRPQAPTSPGPYGSPKGFPVTSRVLSRLRAAGSSLLPTPRKGRTRVMQLLAAHALASGPPSPGSTLPFLCLNHLISFNSHHWAPRFPFPERWRVCF